VPRARAPLTGEAPPFVGGLRYRAPALPANVASARARGSPRERSSSRALGPLGDVLGGRRLIVIAVVGSVAASFAFGFSSSLVALTALRKGKASGDRRSRRVEIERGLPQGFDDPGTIPRPSGLRTLFFARGGSRARVRRDAAVGLVTGSPSHRISIEET
jgi:MFS family permease